MCLERVLARLARKIVTDLSRGHDAVTGRVGTIIQYDHISGILSYSIIICWVRYVTPIFFFPKSAKINLESSILTRDFGWIRYA